MSRSDRSLSYRVLQIAGWAIVLSIFGVLAFVAFRPSPECVRFSEQLIGQRAFEAPPCLEINTRSLYDARLETSHGTIEAVLDPTISPEAVNTFIFLAKTGWYDGSVFHRIERRKQHAYVQGGAASPDGTGHAGFLQPAQPPSPIMRYERGVLAMVVSGPPDQISSHFFLVADTWEAIGATEKGLPRYPPLGRIYNVASLGVLERIAALGSKNGTPGETVVLERVTVTEIPEEPPVTPSPLP